MRLDTKEDIQRDAGFKYNSVLEFTAKAGVVVMAIYLASLLLT